MYRDYIGDIHLCGYVSSNICVYDYVCRTYEKSTCLHVCTYLYTVIWCTPVYLYIYAGTYGRTHACMFVCMHVLICMLTHVCVYINVCLDVCRYITEWFPKLWAHMRFPKTRVLPCRRPLRGTSSRLNQCIQKDRISRCSGTQRAHAPIYGNIVPYKITQGCISVL